MFGPGEYVPDPTEGIVDIQDLPRPQLAAYSRNHDHTSCPRCDHLAYRHTAGQHTLHDLGDLSTGCPVDLLVTYSSHYCSMLPASVGPTATGEDFRRRPTKSPPFAFGFLARVVR